MANEEIRAKMYKNRIPQWKLAIALNCSENTIWRRLRTPLNPEEKKLFNEVLDRIMTEG